ncbi:3-oxo-tetronate kinase [Leifsonia aquatica]|uniref:3-oxo-tetronate kinase n=1 Tax=Leifsonia aquatica TaxID=144185 RepID=UPI000A70C8A0|nr:3-oxo-tetronate kinase [Leifsonia aquatica]
MSTPPRAAVRPMLGVVADDVTGATDVAAALSRAGLRTLLSLTSDLGDPETAAETAADAAAGDSAVDAIVVGLKTRSLPAAEAVAQSLAAVDALRRRGARQFYVKYCSTFDSTAEGNIGPITEALAVRLGARTVVTTPAAPLHGRTVYQGHLFVGDALLDETHMREHPITPMRDSSVPRLLRPQSAGAVGLLPLDAVRAGAVQVRERIAAAEADGIGQLVADAVSEDDLSTLAEAIDDAVLVAGSAGLIGAMALRRPRSEAAAVPPPTARTAIIAGSCSRRTLEQIDRFRATEAPSHHIVATAGDTATSLAERALAWWDELPEGASGLLYSSSPADERASTVAGAAELYEQAAGRIAAGLAQRGVQRMLIAGGETSGAVIRALGTGTAIVGEEAALGAPWIHDVEHDLHLVLKSGNFGEPGLFVDVALRDAVEAGR